MQAIVVTLDRAGVREDTKVFIVKDDRYTNAVVEAAEKSYVEFIKQIEPSISDDDLEAAKDNGIFDEIDGQYRSVTLTWVFGVKAL